MWDHYQGRAAARYDRIWGDFTRRMLRPMIPLALSSLPEQANVLDAGCGTGVLLAQLAVRRPDLRLLGTDASSTMLAQAAQRLGDNARLAAWDLDQPPPHVVTAAAPFDLITCTNVLHYVAAPFQTVCMLARLLAPGGRLIVSDFIRHGWWWTLFERALRLADRRHRRTLTARDLVQLVTLAGLRVVRVQPISAGGPWRGVLVAGCSIV
jgi:2-polyprenyl-3-methyl-5-hydroxy-6-metoxy-1,4-benzoquinol methylase